MPIILRKPLRLIPSICALAITLLAGCERSDPVHAKITVATPLAFQQWRARTLRELPREQSEGLDAALQELKFKAMAEGRSGQDAIDTAVRAQIEGKTVHDVFLLGYSSKISRLEQQRASIEAFLAQNAQLQTRPDDLASANYLARKRDQQVAQRETIDREILNLRERMKALGVEPLKPEAATEAASANSGEAGDTSGPVLIHK